MPASTIDSRTIAADREIGKSEKLSRPQSSFCFMPRLNFTEIAPARNESVDPDQFEKFAAVFFQKVLGGTVTQGPTRGADGGIDLKVEFLEDGVAVKKLVSCKHYAQSRESVGIGHETDVTDRLGAWGCSVFVGFYSTIASTALEAKLQRLRRPRR